MPREACANRNETPKDAPSTACAAAPPERDEPRRRRYPSQIAGDERQIAHRDALGVAPDLRRVVPQRTKVFEPRILGTRQAPQRASVGGREQQRIAGAGIRGRKAQLTERWLNVWGPRRHMIGHAAQPCNAELTGFEAGSFCLDFGA
jgi:hypothetical protein